ncbi:dipeptidyl aminopeptidase/acylaminoacyl peptidase [Neolewinella xylanilytica]|uniref:Dipeptidyl aminopeptidase/acylaminoacyl peptidase n=1 Tax=Neolewinella xylanilytica TaxID=1514080 RepID=A0A2S6I5K0_9BACT|nr:S9 family peptidase [Neolewinella xylanilytica]PPK86409.1 dipeptidyl aminopeptidase/acylaminoacyl peptidase [Neolewinella xylanilytica]
MIHRLPTVFFLVFLCTCVSAQQPVSEPGKWTVDDVIHTESMNNVLFSPDGKLVLWSKLRATEDKQQDKFVSNLYLTRLEQVKDGKFMTVQLTNGDESDHSARFDRAGEYVYFLSSRDEGKKLWKISLYGGEAQEVHEFENGIGSIEWMNDTTLLFVSHEGKSLETRKREEEKDDVIVIEDTSSWQIDRIYAYDLKSERIRRITENDKPVAGYSVSKNGHHLAYVLEGSPHQAADAQPKSAYYLRDLRSGTERRILEGLQGPRSLTFTDDGNGLYFTATRSSDPQWDGAGIGQLYYLPLDGKPSEVPLDWEDGVNTIRVVGNDVVADLANRATERVAIYRKGSSRTDIALDTMADHVSLLAFSNDGSRVVLEYSTASRLPVYYIADFSDNAVTDLREIVSLNDKLKKKTITRSEVIEWAGYGGELVTGILYYPTNYQEGRAYPLMLSIHGGPFMVDTDRWSEDWSTYPQLLTQRGAFVLKPNYHGSSNHGLAYLESIKQNYYDPEMEDITAGIDKLIAEGMVDPDSLGTMGWSNGAILTTMLTVRYPDRFKVACPGAGDVNWTSDFGTCEFGVSFDQSYFGGAPWDDTNGKTYNEAYVLKSPIFEMEKVRTPTIIFHGSEDRAVPRDQGWEYYRALQQIAKAPVRFLWFPGQPHDLQKVTHQKRKMEEELAWIDTYLFGKERQDNPALKEDSPLAQLLKMDTVARAGALFGTLAADGTLLPEVVALGKDSISLGRFELTHAQYASFRPDHDFGTYGPNDPVMLGEKAAADYLKWLSGKVGKHVRLPNAEEAMTLQKQARKVAAKENTLNYWAGYAITPEEVTVLRKKIDEVHTPLVKPVGSFAPVQLEGQYIYDLGGNLAERTQQGSFGYSAYDYVDEAAPAESMPASDHVGLRIVVEAVKR